MPTDVLQEMIDAIEQFECDYDMESYEDDEELEGIPVEELRSLFDTIRECAAALT